MNEQNIFILAEDAMKRVVGEIKDEQWGMELPADFRLRNAPDKPITLREIINYHAYDDAWVPDMLAGKTMEEVGKDAFKGDLLGDDPKGNFAKIADTAITAARGFSDLEKTVHLSYGDYPAREYLWHITLFRGLRSYDLAKVIGADTKMSDELVQGLWDQITPHAEEWRAIGLFGPKIEVPDDAPLQDRLLGLVGRQV